jgi:hypothetical protein
MERGLGAPRKTVGRLDAVMLGGPGLRRRGDPGEAKRQRNPFHRVVPPALTKAASQRLGPDDGDLTVARGVLNRPS